MSRFEDIYPLLSEYDMFAQMIEVVKEPNVYKALTPYGTFACKRTDAPHGRLRYVSGMLRHLQRRGWEGAVPIAYTKYDEPFVVRDRSTYYLSPWHQGKQEESSNASAWVKPSIERLAELHLYTQNYRYDDPRQVEPLIDSLLNRWTLWLEGMERHRSNAESLSYPSPFDVVFMANHGYINEMAMTAIQALRNWREAHETYAHFRLSLIHGNPHPSHFLFDKDGKVRLVNFDRAVFDTPVRDLTMFYRSYFFTLGDEETASSLLRDYSTIFPLQPDEAELLSAFLLYPERIMRDIETYYGKKREWNELAAVRKLERDLDRFIRLSRWTQRAF